MGWNQNLGQSGIVANDKGYRQHTVEIGYGYGFNLVKVKCGGISYIPSIGLGSMGGTGSTVTINKGAWFDYDSLRESYGIQGFGGSVTKSVEINTAKERFGLFYENKIALYHNNHEFFDGTQTYNIRFMGISVGKKFMLFNPNNRK